MKEFLNARDFPRASAFLNADQKNRYNATLTTEKAIAFSKLLILDFEENKKANVNITIDNKKLSGISSVAFNVFLTCENRPCFSSCYGNKGHYLTVSKLKNMTENTFLIMFNARFFVRQLSKFLKVQEAMNPRSFFRFCETGDLPDQKSLSVLSKICKENPKTKFLLRTKKFQFINDFVKKGGVFPKNRIVRISKFSYCGLEKVPNPNGLLTTDCQKNPQRSTNLCPGLSVGCSLCKKCFDKRLKEIIFKKHN